MARFINHLIKENKMKFNLFRLRIIVNLSPNALMAIVPVNLQKFPIFDRGLK